MTQTARKLSWRSLLSQLRHLFAESGDGPSERTGTGAESKTDEGTGAVATDGGARAEHADQAHVQDVPDGAGCTEIWEHLSDDEPREASADD